MVKQYVIERRHDDGSLDLKGKQAPFGPHTEDDLARMAWASNPDAILMGEHILSWVSDNVDPAWRTRVKTW